MRALQAGLIGALPSGLSARSQAEDGSGSGSALDASPWSKSLVSSGGSQPWRGLRRYSPGQKLILRQRQGQGEGNRALAGDTFGSSGSGSGDGSGLDSPSPSSSSSSTSTLASKSDDTFCIIEGRDTVRDFAQMQLQEIRDNINSRRNKIFLLMEEVRRLRIQQRIKSEEAGVEDTTGVEEEELSFTSSIPFLPPLTSSTLQQYYATCFGLVSGIILFGGLLAPVLELKLGVGGTSYAEFIRSMHLPSQLSQVDPIVASFSGGAVGVISALMVVEVNNVRQHDHKRCHYCSGTGYLACARCSGSGALPVSLQSEDGALTPSLQSSVATTTRCPNCAGAAKVMCPTCLCTGVALATEHDPRIDPFNV